MLASEDSLLPETAAQIQLRATELKRRLDERVREIREQPVLGNDPVRIGELRQLEGELAALRSTALQRMSEKA